MNYYNFGKNYYNLDSESDSELNIQDILNNEKNMIDFLRGYMEFNSNFTKPTINDQLKQNDNVILDIFINMSNKYLFINILDKIDIKYKMIECRLQKRSVKYDFIFTISFYNVLDILSKLYYPAIKDDEYDIEYYENYMILSNYHQIIFNKETNELKYLIPKCKYIIDDKNAIIPTKAHASDVGYDLSIIKVFKQISKSITMYDTGIIIIPTYGYYFEVYARSSLSKTGYILANSVGIIDGNYKKTIKVSLIKIDSTMPDIKLPFKGMQLVLRKMIHFELNKSKLL
jgi:dUTPase